MDKTLKKPNKIELPISSKTQIVVFTFIASQLFFYTFFSRQVIMASDLTPDNVLNAVNNERSLRDLTTLHTDSRLTSAAAYKAQDMITRKYFSHVDPDGNYIWPKIASEGYTPYLELGENLAINFSSIQSLMDAWMNSPTHRANILQDSFQDQGGGVSFGNVQNGEYESSIANTFGTLAVAKQTPTPTKTPTPASAPIKQQTVPTQITSTPPPAPMPAPAVPTTVPPQKTPVESSTPQAIKPSAETNPVIALRGDNSDLNFALPSNSIPSSSPPPQATTSTVLLSPPNPPNTPTILNPAQGQTLDVYKINRYVILGFGILILIMLLSDLKDFAEKQADKMDKKINNLLVLIISLVVAGLLYWF